MNLAPESTTVQAPPIASAVTEQQTLSIPCVIQQRMRPVQVDAATELLVVGALVHEPLGEQIRMHVKLPDVMSLRCRHELCIIEFIEKVAHLLVSDVPQLRKRRNECH